LASRAQRSVDSDQAVGPVPRACAPPSCYGVRRRA
jgi:hypothetical protein